MMMPPEPGDPWYVDDPEANQDLADFANEHLGLNSDFFKKQLQFLTTYSGGPSKLADLYYQFPKAAQFIEYTKADAILAGKMYDFKETPMDNPDTLNVLMTEMCEWLQTEPSMMVMGVPVDHLELTGSPAAPCPLCKAVIGWLYGQNELHADHYNGHPDFQADDPEVLLGWKDDTEATLLVVDGSGQQISFTFTSQMFKQINNLLDLGLVGVVNQKGKDYIVKTEYTGSESFAGSYATDMMGSGVPAKAGGYMGLLLSAVNFEMSKQNRKVAEVKYQRETPQDKLTIKMKAYKKPLAADIIKPSSPF